ncbi:unnamed protein product, partial [Ectocarpus sp. 8 AP-2014]
SSEYVVCSDDTPDTYFCHACKERLHLTYHKEMKEWVYRECVEHDGEIVHKTCRDVAREKSPDSTGSSGSTG